MNALSLMKEHLINKKLVVYTNYVLGTKLSETLSKDLQATRSIRNELTIIDITDNIPHFKKENAEHFKITAVNFNNETKYFYIHYFTQIEIT